MTKGNVWAVTMVRDEADIIAPIITHLLAEGVDHIIVCDHGSTDQTGAILGELQARTKRITLFQEYDRAFYQGRIHTLMAQMAYENGAEWVIPTDADELWYCLDPSIPVADVLRQCEADVIGASMINHYETSADNPKELNPFKRMQYRHRDPNPLDKVIVRFRPGICIDEGHHRVFDSYGRPVPGIAKGICIRHFSVRGAERFVAKAVRDGTGLELAKGLDESIGAHSRMYKQTVDQHGPKALAEHYRRHFYFELPDERMVWDPAPYHGE